MRLKQWTIVLAGAALVAPVLAQMPGDASYDGIWSVALRTEDGRARTATFTIRNFAGEWSGSLAGLPKGDKTCRGQRFPLTVNESSVNELQVTVFGSAKSPGCPDLTLHLAPKTKDSLEGTVEDVGSVEITRKPQPVRKR